MCVTSCSKMTFSASIQSIAVLTNRSSVCSPAVEIKPATFASDPGTKHLAATKQSCETQRTGPADLLWFFSGFLHLITGEYIHDMHYGEVVATEERILILSSRLQNRTPASISRAGLNASKRPGCH